MFIYFHLIHQRPYFSRKRLSKYYNKSLYPNFGVNYMYPLHPFSSIKVHLLSYMKDYYILVSCLRPSSFRPPSGPR